MSSKLFVRVAVVILLIMIAGVSFNGKILSADTASAREDLKTTQSFALSSVIQEQAELAQTPSSYAGYTRITDNEEKITVQVPVEWSDIESGAWTFKGRHEGVFLAASGDLGNFYATKAQPGVLIGVSNSLARSYDKDGLLGLERRDLVRQCIHQGQFDYQNNFYNGHYDHFTNCSGTPGLLVFTAASADQKSLILIRIITTSEADLQAVDTIINTFQVLGDPETDEHHDG